MGKPTDPPAAAVRAASVPCRPGVCSCMPTRDLSCRSLSPFPSFLLLSRRPQTSPNRVERLFKLSSHYPLDRRRPDLPPSQVSPRELLPYSYCIAVHELGIGPPTNPPAGPKADQGPLDSLSFSQSDSHSARQFDLAHRGPVGKSRPFGGGTRNLRPRSPRRVPAAPRRAHLACFLGHPITAEKRARDR